MPDAGVLAYAFSTAGWLDPGTKLLDVGLHEHTPLQARAELLQDPMHMSVAIHELTHFVSLENTLGHVMAFLAMRTKDIARRIQRKAESGEPVDAAWVSLYARRHREYQLMLELWRPLLEGIAVYGQLHEPDPKDDALIEPVDLLLNFSVFTSLMGVDPEKSRAKYESGFNGFYALACKAIAGGPALKHGDTPLSQCFEFVEPEGLRPYFIGHAYVRALQRALASKARLYESSERFFNLLMRILRSSTRALLADVSSWGQTKVATRIYSWVDIVRAAPAERVEALFRQPDAVDVLHFLATGGIRMGYDPSARAATDTVRQIAPQLWDDFETALAQRQLPGAGAPAEQAARLVGAWIAGTMSLNLSSNGVVQLVGWIPSGLESLHAVALKLDGTVWWAALSDADLDRLGIGTETLRKIESERLLDPGSLEATTFRLLIDCSIAYAPMGPEDPLPAESGKVRAKLWFRLRNPEVPDYGLTLTIANAIPGVVGMYLRLPDNEEQQLIQFRATADLRYELRDAPASETLAEMLEANDQQALADVLRELIEEEGLATSRVISDVERRALAAVLGREPIGSDLDLLEQGIRVFPEAPIFKDLITAAYSRYIHVQPEAVDSVRIFNEVAIEKIGKPLFEIDAGNFVRYQGLWGEPT